MVWQVCCPGWAILMARPSLMTDSSTNVWERGCRHAGRMRRPQVRHSARPSSLVHHVVFWHTCRECDITKVWHALYRCEPNILETNLCGEAFWCDRNSFCPLKTLFSGLCRHEPSWLESSETFRVNFRLSDSESQHAIDSKQNKVIASAVVLCVSYYFVYVGGMFRIKQVKYAAFIKRMSLCEYLVHQQRAVEETMKYSLPVLYVLQWFVSRWMFAFFPWVFGLFQGKLWLVEYFLLPISTKVNLWRSVCVGMFCMSDLNVPEKTENFLVLSAVLFSRVLSYTFCYSNFGLLFSSVPGSSCTWIFLLLVTIKTVHQLAAFKNDSRWHCCL